MMTMVYEWNVITYLHNNINAYLPGLEGVSKNNH